MIRELSPVKTPLSAMILYNNIMLGKDLTKEQGETFLKTARTSLSG